MRRQRKRNIGEARSRADYMTGASLQIYTAGIDAKAVQERLKDANATALMVPRNVIALKELPLLGSGKTDYQSLNRMAKEQVKP